MGKSQRTKGAAFERKLCRLLREAMPGCAVERGLQGRGGTNVPDVTAGPFFLEAKHRLRPNVREALEQAEGDSPPGKWPVAVCKWHGTKDADAVVAMRLEDWLEIIGQWWLVAGR